MEFFQNFLMKFTRLKVFGIPVMDDQEGKACCLAMGLNPLGTGSLLILAKREGAIPSVKEALIKLRSEGLWISDQVMAFLIKNAGE